MYCFASDKNRRRAQQLNHQLTMIASSTDVLMALTWNLGLY